MGGIELRSVETGPLFVDLRRVRNLSGPTPAINTLKTSDIRLAAALSLRALHQAELGFKHIDLRSRATQVEGWLWPRSRAALRRVRVFVTGMARQSDPLYGQRRGQVLRISS